MKIGKWNITKKDSIWFIVCLVLILCFLVGLLIFNNDGAASVLSGASTAISIVLSIVAILYTMIEGANSSRINQDSINKLQEIDLRLKEVTKKLSEQKDIDKRIRHLIPKLNDVANKMDNISSGSKEKLISSDIKKELIYLSTFINEDIEE